MNDICAGCGERIYDTRNSKLYHSTCTLPADGALLAAYRCITLMIANRPLTADEKMFVKDIQAIARKAK